MINNAALGLLGFSETPPTYLDFDAHDTYEYRQECLAWSLIKRRSRSDIKFYLEKVKSSHGEDRYNDLIGRLNKLRLIVKARREELKPAAAS